MCDYSLQTVRSRPAQVGDELITTNFRTGTRGLAPVEDRGMAVCVMPGTELSFQDGITAQVRSFFGWVRRTKTYQTAIFRQVNKDKPDTHHDAVEFPDGKVELLTNLSDGVAVTVLQLPAKPRNAKEVAAQKRVEFVG